MKHLLIRASKRLDKLNRSEKYNCLFGWKRTVCMQNLMVKIQTVAPRHEDTYDAKVIFDRLYFYTDCVI